jgi:hypothetical protein
MYQRPINYAVSDAMLRADGQTMVGQSPPPIMVRARLCTETVINLRISGRIESF